MTERISIPDQPHLSASINYLITVSSSKGLHLDELRNLCIQVFSCDPSVSELTTEKNLTSINVALNIVSLELAKFIEKINWKGPRAIILLTHFLALLVGTFDGTVKPDRLKGGPR